MHRDTPTQSLTGCDAPVPHFRASRLVAKKNSKASECELFFSEDADSLEMKLQIVEQNLKQTQERTFKNKDNLRERTNEKLTKICQ